MTASAWLRDLQQQVAAEPYLVGWANADDELKSETFATLMEAVGCVKRLTDAERHSAFIEDRSKRE
jgi:hypothetical protein